MSLLTIALLGAGALLCIIEVFVPKIGLTGLLGIVLLVAGGSSYYIDGYRLKEFLGLGVILALGLALVVFIELFLENKGVIHNPNRYKLRTYTNPLLDLVGKSGKAITNIDLGGTIEIDGKLYYAISTSVIFKDNIVQVIGVDGNSLVVK